MSISDIRILEVHYTFTSEAFRTPLLLSTGPISECVYAKVEVSVINREGAAATGTGGVFLSDLWSFPSILLTSEVKVTLMKQLVEKLHKHLLSLEGYWDGLQLGHLLTNRLSEMLIEVQRENHIAIPIPKLCGLVCSAPFDAAIHDAWGKAHGLSTYDMYNEQYMNHDLSYYLGVGWEGVYPSDYLIKPRSILRIQHVVGAGDILKLTTGNQGRRPMDDLPFTLEEWILKEQLHAFKLKINSMDVERNFTFICNVFDLARETARNMGIQHPIELALDPNEIFTESEPMVVLLQSLKHKRPDVYAALTYVEQPTPRDLSSYNYTLHTMTAHKPVIIDESLEDMANLLYIDRLGWSGVALKTCKGHTHALLTYCWARRKQLYITVQDLTNVGMAHVQSAHLCSRFAVSSEAFEFNSRQYTPFSQPEVKQRYPSLFEVSNGCISLDDIQGVGLY